MARKSIFKTVRLTPEELELIHEMIRIIKETYGVEVSISDIIRASLVTYYKVLRLGKR